VSLRVLCPTCNQELSAPESLAGKKAKCSKCGSMMIIPEVIHPAEEVGPSDPLADSQEDYKLQGDMPDGPPRETGTGSETEEPVRRPCPMCGEMIVASAAKCRFCGSVFDSNLRNSRFSRGQSYSGFAVTSMILGIIGIFIPCIGALLGILATIFGGVALGGMNRSQNSDGKGMAITGLVLGILELIGWILWWLVIIAAASSG
jgi:predicted RNA-binding Zn-ribbon protein involved in translation (DUF1610 family)